MSLEQFMTLIEPRAIVAALLVFFVSTASSSAMVETQCGKASWYAMDGKKTASGELADPDSLTAAHRTLPFGTEVRVENLENGKTVTVRINDRGPHVASRVIDVSKKAAIDLGFKDRGQARVRISSLTDNGEGKALCK